MALSLRHQEHLEPFESKIVLDDGAEHFSKHKFYYLNTNQYLLRIVDTQLNKMVFLHLFIVNKSGGLVHHRALSDKAPHIGTNEWLRIGSTFHSLHAIAAEASPIRLPKRAEDGIEEIQALGMTLRCLQTRTGVKFVIT